MEYSIKQNTKTKGEILVLVFAGLITWGLFLLRYFDIVQMDFDLVVAPFVVVALLVYAERLLLALFRIPIRFFSKATREWKHPDRHSKQQINLKQS